jgi:hypothetical protein
VPISFSPLFVQAEDSPRATLGSLAGAIELQIVDKLFCCAEVAVRYHIVPLRKQV